MLGLLVNTLTGDDEYYRHKSENLTVTFFAFLESSLNFEYFEKKVKPQSLGISEIIDSQRLGYPNV